VSIYLDFLKFDQSVQVTDGPYPSVQLTYDLLRDEDDRMIATLIGQHWLRQADGERYSDIVFRVDDGNKEIS
jgi:hypothetical protein